MRTMLSLAAICTLALSAAGAGRQPARVGAGPGARSQQPAPPLGRQQARSSGVVAPAVAPATDTVRVMLWPAGAPGEPADAPAERVEVNAQDARGPTTRLLEVHAPSFTVYRARTSGAAGPAILVFPGGSYRTLAYDIEGTEVCDWLTRSGITCVLVRYRVPQPDDSTRYRRPLQDAQRALGLVRLHARDWGIDPHRVGVIGFSAGAHLAATLSNQYATRSYPLVDAADGLSCRPDFAMILYPGWVASSAGPSPEVRPSAATPPTFLVQAEDDFAHMENSLFYELALKQAGVSAELHIYARGGHGYGLRARLNEAAAAWPGLALRWLHGLGVLGSAPLSRQP